MVVLSDGVLFTVRGGLSRPVRGGPRPSTWAWRCSCPISLVTSARTHGTGDSTCRWTGWRRLASTRDAFLAAPKHSAALGHVVERVLHAADQHYQQATAGISRLPMSCRLGVGVARLLYSEIGHEVRRRGLDLEL